MNEISKYLIAAKSLIDTPEKWGRGTTCGVKNELSKNRTCAGIAIGNVTVNIGNRRDVFAALLEVIDAKNIIYWNDAPERTHSDIMNAFDAAIAEQEKST